MELRGRICVDFGSSVFCVQEMVVVNEPVDFLCFGRYLIFCFAAGFVRALEIFAVCFGLRLAFGQDSYVRISLSLGVIPCRNLPKIS